MNDRLFTKITASMDQKRAAAADIGEKETISQLELIFLASLANIGLFYLLSLDDDETINPDQQADLKASLNDAVTAIGCEFAHPEGAGNGVMRMANAGAAVLTGERFRKFIMGAR